MKTYSISFPELKLSREDVLLEMGYKDIPPEPYLTDAINELWPKLEREVIAECAFIIEEGALIKNAVIISDLELKTGSTITTLLENSVQFAVFAATAGRRFEEIINVTKKEGDILKIYLADITGSCIAERAGERMEEFLEKEIGSNMHTNRFSPGYCGWHLTEQRQLFKLLGGNPCGISLSEVCLMTPIKSISGIIGIGENVSRKQYACQYCELETCYKKRK